MTDESTASSAVRGLFGRDSVYVLLWGVQLGMAALFTPLTTRVLGASRFGFVAACIAVMQVLCALAGLSLQTAVQRQYASSGERDARRVLTLAIAISLLVFAVANATGHSWAPALGLGDYPRAVRFAVMWACCTGVSNAALGLLRSRDQLARFATVSLLQSVVAEALGLLLVVSVRRAASEYVLGQFLAQAGAVAFGLIMARPLVPRWRDASMLWAALRFSVPLLPAALAVFVLESSDRLVLQSQLGSDAVARYAIAYNIGFIPMVLLPVLNNVWMPRVFALSETATQRTVLAQSRDALYALLIPVTVGLSIGAPVLLRVWAPSSYHPDGLLTVTALVVATAFPGAAALAHTRSLLAAGRTLPVAMATIAAAIANIGLNLLLVRPLGIDGSALATLLSYVLLQGALGAVARRVIPLARPSQALVVELAVAVAVVFAATLLPVSTPFLAVRLALAVACAGGFLVLLASLIRHSPRQRRNRVAAWMQSRARLAAV